MFHKLSSKTKWRPLRIGFKLLVALLFLGATLLPYHSIMASTIPTFDISRVETDDTITIVTHNFPASTTFVVRMGEYGTLGIDGIAVGTFDSGAGGSFSVTFSIPAALKGRAKIAIRTDSTAGGYYSFNWFYNKTSSASGSTPSESSSGSEIPSDHSIPSKPTYLGIPTISIVDVVADEKVTFRTKNYPKGMTFTVRMGEYGGLGIGGIVVGEFESGDGGSMEKTFDIPEELRGDNRIAVRADAADGYYSYNWFWNHTGTGTGSSGSSASTGGKPSYAGIPSFKIIDANRDDDVTIQTHNFPADVTFTVRMGKYGTLGAGGIEVGSTDSGDGGTFNATYAIPDELKGDQRIAIRLESSAGYFAYNWFWNNTVTPEDTSDEDTSEGETSGDTGGKPVFYAGIPTFSISSVVHGDTVTIQANNFPPDQSFVVRMGAYGTLGIGGIEVGSTDTGEGGSFSATYAIPDELKDSQRIAIRMESSSGYFAYNWFWNTTAN